MRHHVLAAIALAFSGCSSSHGVPPEAWSPSEVRAEPGTYVAPVASDPTIDGCLGVGGELVEVGAVDNNDVHDHGALLTFGMSPGGVLAAAGADGTLKFWTLESELLGVIDGSALTYGSETGAVPITDLAFDGDLAIAGDVRGLVQSMGADGTFTVLGGTMPDVPIVAVAFDPDARTLAHAQEAPGVAPVVVRRTDGSIELTQTIDDLRDLGFDAEGRLLVAGAAAGAAAIEVRDAADPRVVAATLRPAHTAPVRELAVAREGGAIVAISDEALIVVREGAVALESAGGGASIDLTPSGAYALDVSSGAAVRVRATDDGREVASVPVADAIAVRVDATGRRVIVGSSDAMLHVLACVVD